MSGYRHLALLVSLLFFSTGSQLQAFFGFGLQFDRHGVSPAVSVGFDSIGHCGCGGPLFDVCYCGRIHSNYCHGCYSNAYYGPFGFFGIRGGGHRRYFGGGLRHGRGIR